MAIKEAKTNTDLDALFTQLAEPFDPNQIKWRVTHTTQDGSRGAVVAYADPRAYTDRLNQLFTPTGWTRTYEVSTVSAVTRMKKDKLIQTGKVLVTCTLTITGLGCHAGSGEDWADESNAMTTAEAQAFKRAASCYGLGRYLYNLAEMWVPLNEHRQPFEFPSLPQWALPKTGAPVKSHPASGPHPATVQRGPIDQRILAEMWVPLNEHRQPFEFPSLPQWALPKTGAPVKNHPASGPHPALVQRGPIDQRIRARSKAFGAFSAIQSTARYCGVSRERRRRTPSPTRSCRRMSQRRWNVPLGESARRTLWPSRSAIRNSSPCLIGCTSGQ